MDSRVVANFVEGFEEQSEYVSFRALLAPALLNFSVYLSFPHNFRTPAILVIAE